MKTQMIPGQTITAVNLSGPQATGETTNGMAEHEETWDMHELIDYVETVDSEWRLSHHHRDDHESDWTPHSWAETQELARYGWTEGTKRMVDIQSALPEIGAVRRGRISYDYVGSRPSVQRYVAGEPKSMVRVRKTRELPVVCIRANGWLSWKVTSEEMANWSVGLVSLLDSLDNMGVMAELMVTYRSEGRSARGTTRPGYQTTNVMVRTAGQPIDIDRLAFVFGNTSWARRYMFGYMESNKGYKRILGPTLGRILDPEPGSADLVIDGITDHRDVAKDPVKAVEYFRNLGAKLVAESEGR